MSLTSGTKLGPYEIKSPLGAGGMGEVYKATDTRLDRIVAIKVLPEHVASDPDLKKRFEREARTVAALNHPHICTLHDIGTQDGVDYLVMEYLEGETLTQRLTKGALPLDQALKVGIEIADALDKAHRQGVVHRDLKPGNIMLTKVGAKLLDFGLAKKVQTTAGKVSSLSALTQESPLTSKGAIVGTFQYMAPEQLEGKEADSRTDVFAFGVVLYEMVTGKKAFEGKSLASLSAAILTAEPRPVSTLQPMAPTSSDHVIGRCLAKDPDSRWQTAADLKHELVWIASAPATIGVPVVARRLPLQGVAWAVAGLALGALAAAVVLWTIGSSPPRTQTGLRFTLTLPGGQLLGSGNGISTPLSVSPDGTQVVFSARQGADQPQLFVRPLDQFEARPIPGTEGALAPFFSPNGEQVGFFASGALKKVSLAGGAPVTICDVVAANAGATWGSDDIIVFATAFTSTGLFRVSAAGGRPEALTTPDFEQGESSHRLPHFLPDGNSVLFTVEGEEQRHLALVSLENGERQDFSALAGAADAWYVPTGHLVFAQAGTLLAVPFDLARHEIIGAPAPVLDGVYTSPAAVDFFGTSLGGTLVYVPSLRTNFESSVVWVDREGRSTLVTQYPGRVSYPRLSPDSTQLGVVIGQVGNRDVWVSDIARGARTRVTSEGDNTVLIWTPDGRQVTFASDRSGPFNLYRKPADGSGDAELLLESEHPQYPGSWSSDGQLLAFYEINPTTGRDIWVLPQDGDPAPFVVTPFSERSPRFSPDDNWIAYISDESGQDEVYVQPYPGPGGKVTISTDSGQEPVWSADGRELMYRHGDDMMAVSVETQPSFTAGRPRRLFEQHYDVALGGFNQNYDVSPDGQQFLMVSSDEEPLRQFNIVQNWFDELQRLVPTP